MAAKIFIRLVYSGGYDISAINEYCNDNLSYKQTLELVAALRVVVYSYNLIGFLGLQLNALLWGSLSGLFVPFSLALCSMFFYEFAYFL